MSIRFFLIFLIILQVSIGCSKNDNRKLKQPNIVYILADDMGYGEVAAYGQEKIETPNIDLLAQNGMKFTQHYAGSAVCAPSRYMLMTGKNPGHAYIRDNDAVTERGDVWDYKAMDEHPELEGNVPIPSKTITIAEVLKEAGYQTGIVGKWGLGAPFTEGLPNKQGFDFFYGYVGQRQAHTYYPTHLWKNNKREFLDNELVDPHQKLPEGADPNNPDNYAVFQQQPDYAPDLMMDEALDFIEENRDHPFFLYFPTNLPHVALQAPQRWVDYYRKKFGEEDPYLGDRGYIPNQYPHATYAAMISYLDEQVGEIVEKLKDLDLYENTLIIFTSDNGPTTGGGVDAEYFDSAAPFITRDGRVKGSLYEGGIRVPMIATWKNKIQASSTTDHISAFWDVMPTFADIAGITPPNDIDGISFLPTLLGKENQQKKHKFLYWEYPSHRGQQAVRMGKWKGIRKDVMEGNLEIDLYNLEEDIREENNVANQHPEIIKKIQRIMKREHIAPKLERFRMGLMEADSCKNVLFNLVLTFKN